MSLTLVCTFDGLMKMTDITSSGAVGAAIVLIRNIPSVFHSSDLREFFSLLVEQSAFSCFHFRHRPEKIEPIHLDVKASDFCEGASPVTSNKLRKATLCCFVKIHDKFIPQLFLNYNGKNWTSTSNQLMSSRCHIIRLKTPFFSSTNSMEPASAYSTRQERRVEQRYHMEHQKLRTDDFESMIEMNPPALMPHGNVGTPTEYFLDLIQKCQMPTSLIRKLGLRFPKGRKNRKYGQVGMDYGWNVVGRGDDRGEGGEERGTQFSWFSEEKGELNGGESTVPVEDGDDLDNDECEEWERHEALNDDVTTHERNKERLFEDEEEVMVRVAQVYAVTLKA